MAILNLAEDLCPVSEFRANINSMLQKTRETHRPILLTERGKSAAVVLSVGDYQDLVYEKELLEDVRMAESQVQKGDFYSTAEIKKLLANRYGRAHR
ncbi:MAG: type II toxin-antitoxin system Phd/YefM family antitoxin [Fibrobacteraceae bacterium]|nr:type II toxin-antitoxin system Phd/YefM family antitoxin [Fibrobacteraceae bacterium]